MVTAGLHLATYCTPLLALTMEELALTVMCSEIATNYYHCLFCNSIKGALAEENSKKQLSINMKKIPH